MGRCHITREPNAPTTAPLASGDHFVDTSTGQTYISVGTSTVNDWILINGEFGDLYDCPASVAIGDAVYTSGNNTVDSAKADAQATSLSFGFVRSKPSSTLCIVDTAGKLDGFSGLTIDKPIFLSTATAGGVTQTPPTGSGTWLVYLGTAVDTNKIDINPQAPIRRI